MVRRSSSKVAADAAPLDLHREIEIARQMADDAVRRYQEAVEAWEAMETEQRVFAMAEGMRPPHCGEVLAALDVTSKIQAKLAAIEARDSVPISALLDFMSQIRGLIATYVPDEATQRALITAIQSLDIRS